jgi:hypothetical protein
VVIAPVFTRALRKSEKNRGTPQGGSRRPVVSSWPQNSNKRARRKTLRQKDDTSKEPAQNQGFFAVRAQSFLPAVSAICSLCDAARQNLGNTGDDSIFYCLNSGHRDS